MVWGLVDPSSFGDYFPDGDFVGWGQRLAAWGVKNLSEEQLKAYRDSPWYAYSGFAIAKFSRMIGPQTDYALPLTPVEPHEWPDEFRTEKSYKSLGSLIKLTGQVLAVDQALKDLIERLEPGIHQFGQIRITMPKGREYPEPYFVMVVGRILQSFRSDLSDEGTWKSYESKSTYYHAIYSDKKMFSGLAMASSVIGSAHLWRERYLNRPTYCLSDILQAEIASAGLRLPKLYKLKSV